MWGNHITAWNLVGGLMQCVCAGKPFTIWNGHAQPLHFLISTGQGCCRSLNVLFQMIMKQQYLFCQKCGELSHWGRVVPVNWHISSDNGLLPVWKPCRNQCGLLYPRFNEVERGVYWFHLVRLSVRPSVRLGTESCPLCIFNNTCRTHFILAHLIKPLQKVCRV